MKPVCEVTHPQITAGNCPWCGEPIGAGNSEEPAGETVWNVDAMAAALGDRHPSRGAITLSNVYDSDLPFEVSIPLFSKALEQKSDRLSYHAEQYLEQWGGDLSADEAARIEAQIVGSAHELALRILVLSYYFLGQRKSAAARDRRHEHIYWLIQHAPESHTAGSPHASIHQQNEQAYEKAKQLWLAQAEAHSDSAKVQGNAASFFTLRDKPLSESLLKKACALEPDNPEWLERLGHLYSLQSGEGSVDARIKAAQAFQAFAAAEVLRAQQAPESHEESGEPLSDEEKRTQALLSAIWNLPQLAKTALAAREFEQARNYATELLEKATSEAVPEFFRNDGNAIHHANLILGQLALREGDVGQAVQYLIAAGKTKGSPQLDSFGPNMSLAKELLERGEQEVVLRYFELCRTFWGSHGEVLDRWSEDVRAGRIPEFGPNLVY